MLRRFTCGAIALTMHAVVVLAIVFHSEPSALDADAPVVMMELAPISAAPSAPVSELAPGPQQAEAEPIEQVKEETPKHQQDAEQELPQEAEPVTLPLGATVLREQTPQTAARELPAPDTKEEIHQEAAVASAPPNAMAVDVRPVSPAPGLLEQPTAATDDQIAKLNR